jgi:ferredoxin--NADP+ reductase
MPAPTKDEIAALRERFYDATITEVIRCSSRVRIIRVRPDAGSVRFVPGQYLALGLGGWEPRADGGSEFLPEDTGRDLLVRHYSFSHPILDAGGAALAAPSTSDGYEFYVVLSDAGGTGAEPRFSPRLFGLGPGDRLHAGGEPGGEYTTAHVGHADDAVFLATGTGEAPHNAMIWDLLSRGHEGRIVSVVCAQRRDDLGYLATHEKLMRLRPAYRYLTLTTRESGGAGRRMRIQEYFASGAMEEDLGWSLDPARAHVFVCGNPGLIGVPRRRPGSRVYPEPAGMIELLEKRGFNADARSGAKVNVHYERFW